MPPVLSYCTVLSTQTTKDRSHKLLIFALHLLYNMQLASYRYINSKWQLKHCWRRMKMRRMTKLVLLLLVVVVTAVPGTKGVSLCDMSEDGLAACKPSVTEPNPVDPSSECCKALSAADLSCLCSYKHSLVLPSLGIDPDLALALPAKCDLTPPADC